MSTTTAKRGGAAKFLALLASLTMIVVGLVGLAAAAPASAASDNLDCQHLPSAPDGQSWVYLTTIQVGGEQTTYNWSYPSGGVYAWVVKSATSYNSETYATPQTSGTAYSTSTNDNNQTQAISHVTLCGLTPPVTPPTSSLTVVKAWVGTDAGASQTFAGTLDSTDAGALSVTVAGDTTGQAWGATQSNLTAGARVVVTEGTVPALKPADFPSGYTCALVTSNYPTYSSNNFDLAAGTNTVTVTNAVTCTAVLPDTSSLTVAKAWVGTNGSASESLAAALDSTDAGPLSVTVAGATTGQAWGATQSNLTAGARVVVTEGTVPALKPADFPSGYTCALATSNYPTYSQNNFDLVAGSNTVTVTNAVTCTADSTPPVTVTPGNPQPPAQPAVAPPVVVSPDSAVASAPLPGTAPVPVVAPAPQPGTVPAPAPGPATDVVSVPAAATVPTAIPAGDGSQAPRLPVWALALLMVGALSAAAAGKQLLGARA